MAEQAVHDEHAEIKKRAMQRLIVAGTLVTAAIVALTVLNHNPEQSTPPASKTVVPVDTKPEPLITEAAVAKTAEEIPSETPPPEAPVVETPAIPDSEAAPIKLPEPPPPQVINRSHSSAPQTPHPGTTPKSRIETAASNTAEPSKNITPQAVTISPAPPEKKAAEAAATASKPASPAVKTPEMPAPKGYVVQLGLFSNYENAVQLQKRLADHGIKSYTETRLHVGPFQNKTEADQAMAKIRSMGINAVLAPAH